MAEPMQSSECVACTEEPELYDYLYLAFIFLITLLSHWVSVDFAAKRNKLTKEIILVHVSAFIETCVSAVVSILLFEPIGAFSLHSCGVKRKVH